MFNLNLTKQKYSYCWRLLYEGAIHLYIKDRVFVSAQSRTVLVCDFEIMTIGWINLSSAWYVLTINLQGMESLVNRQVFTGPEWHYARYMPKIYANPLIHTHIYLHRLFRHIWFPFVQSAGTAFYLMWRVYGTTWQENCTPMGLKLIHLPLQPSTHLCIPSPWTFTCTVPNFFKWALWVS